MSDEHALVKKYVDALQSLAQAKIDILRFSRKTGATSVHSEDGNTIVKICPSCEKVDYPMFLDRRKK